MASEAAGEGQAPQIKVFISYSRKDIAFADRLDAALRERAFEVLIDRSEIYAFEDWWARIQALIAQADTIIFVLSPDSVASPVCAKEVVFAASLNKRFAPVVMQRVDDKLVPETLSRLNFIFFDEEAKFDEGFERLCEALSINIAWIRKHTDYGEAARRWEAEGRPGGLSLRSPALEEAEHWIASRPSGAPLPTEATQAFVTESRRGASRRRNILTGSLAAGLVLALALAGLAYWQRGVAVHEQQIADQQRKRAETTLALATQTANGLVFDLAQKFRDVVGVPATTIQDILDRARKLQEQLLQSGESSSDLLVSEANALGESGRTLLDVGETASALADAKKERNILEAALKQQPNNTLWQYSFAVSYEDIGDVQVAQGNLPEGLQTFQAELAIMKHLADSDPGNSLFQLGLSDAYDRVGAVQAAQGNGSEALESYEASLAIRQHLAKSDPGKTEWQRGLAVSYNKVGDEQAAGGNPSDALQSYRASLSVAEGLVKSDADNALWQDDLLISYSKVADAQVALGDLSDALKSYQASLAIAQRLAQSDPSNDHWQTDLSLSYDSIGAVEVEQGNLSGALKSYQAGLAIRERLAKSDPGNADWQRNLSISYERIGGVQAAQENPSEALTSYEESLAIRKRLAQSVPGNTGWQHDLVISYEEIGDLQLSEANLSDALKSYRESLAVSEGLVKFDAGVVQWQRDLAVAYGKLATAFEKMNDTADAQTAFSKGRAVIAGLEAHHPDDAEWKNALAWFDQQIATPGK